MKRSYYTKKANDGREFRFAEITSEVETKLLEVKVERFTICDDSIAQIKAILGIDDKTDEEELRAVRNGVVDTFGEKAQQFRFINNEAFYRVYEEYQNHLSAITAVIDNIIYSRRFI